MPDATSVIHDLKIPPLNRLEKLKVDRHGQDRIRIDAQWRSCFVWQDSWVRELEIVDYH